MGIQIVTEDAGGDQVHVEILVGFTDEFFGEVKMLVRTHGTGRGWQFNRRLFVEDITKLINKTMRTRSLEATASMSSSSVNLARSSRSKSVKYSRNRSNFPK